VNSRRFRSPGSTELVRRALAADGRIEFLVVEDGSPDGTTVPASTETFPAATTSVLRTVDPDTAARRLDQAERLDAERPTCHGAARRPLAGC
jgi:hypothetical protein